MKILDRHGIALDQLPEFEDIRSSGIGLASKLVIGHKYEHAKDVFERSARVYLGFPSLFNRYSIEFVTFISRAFYTID